MGLIFEIGNEIEVEIENEFEIEIENEFEIEIGNEFNLYYICSNILYLQQTRETFHQMDFLCNNKAAMIIHGMHSRPMVPNYPRTNKNCAEKGHETKKERFLGTS